MRILNVTAQKPDSTGSGTYLSALVASELAAGHEAAVVCGIDDGDPTDAVPRGAQVYPVHFCTPELPFHVCGMSDVMPYAATRYRDLTPEMAAAFERAFSSAVRAAVDAFRPDVVICHHLYLLMAIVRECVPGVPVVGISHSTDLRQLRQHGLARERVAAAASALDGIFALHGAQVAEIQEVLSVDPARISVVGVGYDPAVFHPDPSVPRGPGSLLYVGKICQAKGVPSLLRAVARMEREGRAPSRLRLAGGWGSAQAECDAIRAQAAELSTPVEFLGRLSPSALAEQYRAADTFVLPSFFEGLPLVAVEALACGCKAVLTDLPGVRPWLTSGLPGAPVRWVEVPAVTDVDKPDPAGLPAFEARLAEQLAASLAEKAPTLDATPLSWGAVLGRVLASVRWPRSAVFSRWTPALAPERVPGRHRRRSRSLPPESD